MTKIYKYSFGDVYGTKTITLPKGAKILSLQVQHGEPMIWAEVNGTETEIRKFLFVATGGEVPDDGTYIGTVLLENDCFVLHLYEVT